AKNRADNLIYQTEKTLQDNKDKLPEAEKTAAESALEAARKAVADGDVRAVERSIEDLTKASHRMAEVLYRQSAPPPGGGDTGAGAAGSGAAQGEKKGGGDGIDAEGVGKKGPPATRCWAPARTRPTPRPAAPTSGARAPCTRPSTRTTPWPPTASRP